MKQLLTGCTALMMALLTAANNRIPASAFLVPGKLFFSSQPFGNSTAGNKKSFTSHEYLYGRFELSGTTIKDAFKLKDVKDAYPFLACDVILLENGEEVASHAPEQQQTRELKDRGDGDQKRKPQPV